MDVNIKPKTNMTENMELFCIREKLTKCIFLCFRQVPV